MAWSSIRHQQNVALLTGRVYKLLASLNLGAGSVLSAISLDGDPFKPGFFSIRLKMPDGYKSTGDRVSRWVLEDHSFDRPVCRRAS